MNERWASVAGFDGYEVSDQGRVRSWRPSTSSGVPRTEPVILKPVVQRDGRYTVTFGRVTKRVHRLVAEVFVGDRDPGDQVAHLNGDPTDNRASNLLWCSAKVNNSHKREHGTSGFKLDIERARAIRARYAEGGISQRSLAHQFGIGKSMVHSILSNQKWREYPT